MNLPEVNLGKIRENLPEFAESPLIARVPNGKIHDNKRNLEFCGTLCAYKCILDVLSCNHGNERETLAMYLMTPEEAAKELKVATGTLRRWLRAGTFKAAKNR